MPACWPPCPGQRIARRIVIAAATVELACLMHQAGRCQQIGRTARRQATRHELAMTRQRLGFPICAGRTARGQEGGAAGAYQAAPAAPPR
jgi:hypothetical protein